MPDEENVCPGSQRYLVYVILVLATNCKKKKYLNEKKEKREWKEK